VTDRRKDILEAGLAILREHGLAGLTQPRIAARTGLRQSHLTYYYPTRADLLAAVARAAVAAQLAAARSLIRGVSSAEQSAAKMAVVTSRHENTRVLVALNQAADQEPAVRALFNELLDGFRAGTARAKAVLRRSSLPPAVRRQTMSKIRASGIEPDQRRLNGPQTTGRDYRNLSEPTHAMTRDDDVPVAMRDNINLLADVHRPAEPGRYPVLIAASPYPRQIQDLGAPAGFIEAGASDFFVPRGYVYVIANCRGTGGSGGTFGFFDGQERRDMHDLVEWAAAQPWSDGNVGMIGISYFAGTQMEAAVERPLHLKAIMPIAGTFDLYESERRLRYPVPFDDRHDLWPHQQALAQQAIAGRPGAAFDACDL
jgi:AcrR family transcriptional regulator